VLGRSAMIGPPAKRARLGETGGTSAATLAAEPASSAVASQGAAGGDALSLVVALLAAAGSNSVPIPTLTQALSLLQGAGSGGSNVAAAAAAAQAQAAQAAQALQVAAASAAPAQPLTTEILPEDCVQIPNSCVGWLKGRQGGMIRDIELRSGAQCEIDQTTKDFGYSTAIVRGTLEQKKTARGLIIAEVAKVMDQSGGEFDGSFPGTKEEFHIESQYVGWLKGPKGKVIQDLQLKSGTRIEVDQSTPHLGGYATVKIFGTPEGVAQARSLVANELSKIGPEAAAHIARAIPESATPESTHAALTEYLLGGSLEGALGGMSGGNVDVAEEDSVLIPNAYVGWLKGRQGGMIRDIETRSGAQIDIDQSTKELGYSVARLRGTNEQKRTGRGLIIGEIAKVMDQSGDSLEGTFLGTKEEFRIDGQYIGWLKGPKGKVVQDLQIRSATRIEVDQSERASGYALVKVFGTLEGISQAKALIAAELSKVSPEAAAQVALPIQGQAALTNAAAGSGTAQEAGSTEPDPAALRAALIAMAQQNNMTIPGLTDGAVAPSYSGSATATAAAAVAAAGGASGLESQEVEHVRIPNTCVGWLKGRQGAMIREIETRSGAHVEIDQSTKEEGYSQANVRGSTEQRKTARGLVIAEIAKVMDQSGEKPDENFEGRKIEIKIDSQYVGWLKGPKGKVVQDLQVRSGTRIDVDQSKPELGTATVKIFGDEQGTQQARALIAAELNKAESGRRAGEAARHAAGGLPTALPMQAAMAAAIPGMAQLQSMAALQAGIPGWPQTMSAVPGMAAAIPGYNYLAHLAAANPQALLMQTAQAYSQDGR